MGWPMLAQQTWWDMSQIYVFRNHKLFAKHVDDLGWPHMTFSLFYKFSPHLLNGRICEVRTRAKQSLLRAHSLLGPHLLPC